MGEAYAIADCQNYRIRVPGDALSAKSFLAELAFSM